MLKIGFGFHEHELIQLIVKSEELDIVCFECQENNTLMRDDMTDRPIHLHKWDLIYFWIFETPATQIHFFTDGYKIGRALNFMDCGDCLSVKAETSVYLFNLVNS
jgi:hypothetical protein